MTTNSQNMTLEARIAQKLKDDTLGQLLTEDELTTIIERTIKEVLEKREMIQNPDTGYNKPSLIPGPSFAEKLVQKAIEPTVTERVKTYCESEKFKEILGTAMRSVVGEVVLNVMAKTIKEIVYSHMYGVMAQHTNDMNEMLAQRIKNSMNINF